MLCAGYYENYVEMCVWCATSMALLVITVIIHSLVSPHHSASHQADKPTQSFIVDYSHLIMYEVSSSVACNDFGVGEHAPKF